MIPTFLKTQMNRISNGGGEFCWYHPNKQLGNGLVTCGAVCTFYMIWGGGGGAQQGPDSLENFLLTWH